MSRRLPLYLVVLALAAWVLTWTDTEPVGTVVTPAQTYPWQIETTATGSIRVFGLVLGESRLADARLGLGSEPLLALYRSADGELGLEAYFERLDLGGLLARMVMVLDVPQAHLASMAERAGQPRRAEGGGLRLRLAADDVEAAYAAAIGAITYGPVVDLDPAIVRERFGEPGERMEGEGSVTYWLYPQKGLAIALDGDGKEVLHYVAPADFERLRARLAAASNVAGNSSN
jgi:hypothetical protein